jgi:hypothetical protein
MTDKELLELAAKAIGHKLYWTGEEGYGYSFLYFGPDISTWTPFSGHDKFELGTTRTWNPLTDDGDALRLAAELGLNIYIDRWVDCETNAWKDTDMTPVVDVTEKHHGDIYAATRRAIVRAAAEIGKGM